MRSTWTTPSIAGSRPSSTAPVTGLIQCPVQQRGRAAQQALLLQEAFQSLQNRQAHQALVMVGPAGLAVEAATEAGRMQVLEVLGASAMGQIMPMAGENMASSSGARWNETAQMYYGRMIHGDAPRHAALAMRPYRENFGCTQTLRVLSVRPMPAAMPLCMAPRDWHHICHTNEQCMHELLRLPIAILRA